MGWLDRPEYQSTKAIRYEWEGQDGGGIHNNPCLLNSDRMSRATSSTLFRAEEGGGGYIVILVH